MPSTISNALALLDRAESQMKAVLTLLGSRQPAPDALAQAQMSKYVGAVTGIQQCLKSFACAPPGSRQQRLQQLHGHGALSEDMAADEATELACIILQEVQGLEQELLRADGMMADTDMKVNEWQADIQALRTAHETVLTDSGNSTHARGRTAAMRDEVVVVAAGREDGVQQS